MPDFQKRHYEAIAGIFRTYDRVKDPKTREVLKSLVDDFVWLFGRDNGNFDQGIFRMKSVVGEE